jgi:AcrR family transcriptional regulator
MSQPNPSRTEILAAVASVFVERGFQGATVRELGKAAGVSQGTLYYHIGSKIDALLEIHNAFVDVMVVRLSAVRDSDQPPEAKLGRFIEVMLGTVAMNRTSLALFLRERRALPPDAQQGIREKSDQIDGMLQAILDEGANEGCWDPSISLRAARLGIFGIVSWAVEWWNPDGPSSYTEFADDFTRLVLRGLLPRPERA